MPGTALKEIFAKFGIEFDDEELRRANSSIGGITGKLRQFGQLIAGAAVVSGVRNFISGTIRMGDEIGKTAIQVGLTVQELQAFRHAAELGGVDGAAFTNSLGQLQSRAVQAHRDGGRLAEMFETLGVEVADTNGEVKTGGQLFREVAEGISNVENTSLRTNFAMELMGRAGRRLLPVLNQGSEGLDRAAESFERLGGFSEEASQASEEYTDTMLSFRTVMLSIRSQVIVSILPAFNAITEWLIDTIILFREITEESHLMQVGIVAFATAAVAAGASVLAAWAPQLALFGLIAAAILLAVIAVDDIIVAFEGGDSVISSMTDELLASTGTWIRFADIVNEAAASLRLIADTWNVVGGLIRGVSGAQQRAQEERAATRTGQIQARSAEQARRQGIALPQTSGAVAVPSGAFAGAAGVANIPSTQQTVDARSEVQINITAQGADANKVAQLAAAKVEQTMARHRRETANALGIEETS
jgi:hypothetical protein